MIRASISKKAVVAVSGLILIGFVVAHLLGNLVIFLGRAPFNAYARKLEGLGVLLWIARGVLLAALLAHVWTAVHLARENRRARPARYRRYRPTRTTLAARTMMVSGLLLFAYVVYHLLHFTFQVADPAIAGFTDPLGHRDVYTMVVRGFQNPQASALYILAMGVLYFHLSHGIGSAFQSLGLSNEVTLAIWGRLGRWMAFGLFLGYISIPLAVLAGALRVPGAGHGA